MRLILDVAKSCLCNLTSGLIISQTCRVIYGHLSSTLFSRHCSITRPWRGRRACALCPAVEDKSRHLRNAFLPRSSWDKTFQNRSLVDVGCGIWHATTFWRQVVIIFHSSAVVNHMCSTSSWISNDNWYVDSLDSVSSILRYFVCTWRRRRSRKDLVTLHIMRESKAHKGKDISILQARWKAYIILHYHFRITTRIP